MDDSKLAGFATKSESAAEQMQKASAELVMHEVIKERKCTEFEVADDDFREKGVAPEFIPHISELKIPGVKMEWKTDSTMSVVVTLAKYKGASGSGKPKLREGKEFDGVENDFYIYPPETDKIRQMIEANFNVLLIGPAGAGKTELLEKIIKEMGREILPFNMTEETTVDDFVGQISLKENEDGVVETVFTDGPLTQAMREGMVLQLDELDVAEQGILFVLQRVLEGKDLIISKNHGERLHPAKGFAVVATSNTAGRGDQADIYRSRQILDEAFLDRWKGCVRVNYLKQSDEISVLRRRTGISAGHAKTLTKIAYAARAGFGQDIHSTYSLRKSLAVAELVSFGWSLEDAFKIGVVNKCTDEDAAALCEIYQRVAKNKIDLSDRFTGNKESEE